MKKHQEKSLKNHLMQNCQELANGEWQNFNLTDKNVNLFKGQKNQQFKTLYSQPKMDKFPLQSNNIQLTVQQEQKPQIFNRLNQFSIENQLKESLELELTKNNSIQFQKKLQSYKKTIESQMKSQKLGNSCDKISQLCQNNLMLNVNQQNIPMELSTNRKRFFRVTMNSDNKSSSQLQMQQIGKSEFRQQLKKVAESKKKKNYDEELVDESEECQQDSPLSQQDKKKILKCNKQIPANEQAIYLELDSLNNAMVLDPNSQSESSSNQNIETDNQREEFSLLEDDQLKLVILNDNFHQDLLSQDNIQQQKSCLKAKFRQAQVYDLMCTDAVIKQQRFEKINDEEDNEFSSLCGMLAKPNPLENS